MPITAALLEALNQGISSGILIDTQVILYSHRDSAGRVRQPKALYASSHVLKTIPYFEDLLFGKFAESQSKDLKDPTDEEECAEDYGYLSDSDLEDDEDDKASPPKQTAKSEVQPFDPFMTPDDDEKIGHEVQVERIEKGKVIKIPDTAFTTFQAFLTYLYTGLIEFASFGSEENRRWRREGALKSGGTFVRASPKSIYRLADKYDVPALKKLALNCIRGGVAQCNIIEESFGRFASRYDEIRNLYIKQLAFHWMDDTLGPGIRTGVEKKIKSFARGNLEHATDMLSALWEIANSDGDVKAPSGAAPACEATRNNHPAHWEAVSMAFLKSIKNGFFFDRKYWARNSKAGDVLKPVYFSSIVMDDTAEELKKLVKYVKGRNPVIKDLEGHVNIESDCDGDVVGAKDELPIVKEGKEEHRAVLITGSFSAWKSLFFYRCTDTISFAPLKSQGVDSRSNYIRENTIATISPPCSPKSIYILANLLRIQPLCDKALGDIKSKISSENAVSEVFSWITAGQKEVMEMQCDLLTSKFRDQKTIGLVKENIKHISDGSASYRAGALQLGFEKAFEFKKKKKQPPGTKLRCPQVGCTSHLNHVSYSSIGGNIIYCQSCVRKGQHNYLRCVACGHGRTGHFISCQSCAKKFL